MEAFRSLNEIYYRNANCCLLVYDITRKDSFVDCKGYFFEKLREKCDKDIPVILLGNKSDLEDEREVPSEDGANFAKDNEFLFLETSCLKNKNVADAFETLVELTHRKMIEKKNELDNNEKQKEKGNNIKISNQQIKKKKIKILCCN